MKRKSTAMLDIVLYKDAAGESRWRIVATNGNIKADSGESYTRPVRARDAFESIAAHIKADSYRIITDEELGAERKPRRVRKPAKAKPKRGAMVRVAKSIGKTKAKAARKRIRSRKK